MELMSFVFSFFAASTVRKSPENKKAKIEPVFLDSLFSAPRSIYMGAAGQMAYSYVFYTCTDDPIYLGFVLLSFVYGFARYVHVQLYNRRKEEILSEKVSEKEIDMWATSIWMAATGSAGILGLSCMYSVMLWPNTWAAGMSLALATGSMISTVGRNFGDERSVRGILIACFAPIIFGFSYHAVVAQDYLVGFIGSVMLVPFVLAVHEMSSEVRRRMGHAESQQKAAEIKEAKYAVAISNMPNGLIFLDRAGTVKFLNTAAREMFKVSASVQSEGKAINWFIDSALRRKRITVAQGVELSEKIKAMISGNSALEVMRFSEDFAIEFSIGHAPSEIDGVAYNAPKSSMYENHVAIVCENITQRIKNDEKLQRLANYDYMSDLANRRYIIEQLEHAQASMDAEQELAICMFDVDKFKTINDTLGHKAGDDVIRAISRSMRQIAELTPNVLVSRLGGDEFVLAITHLPADYNPVPFFEHAFSIICKSYEIGGRMLDVKCSGGVLLRSNRDFQIDTAFSMADHALYKVKEDRKARLTERYWTLFDDELEQQYNNAQQMRQELEAAVRQNQIVVYYQPMFTPDGQTLKMCEALCRWEHPDLGILGPDNFIRIAEGMNLINDITRLVLMKSCLDCASWDNDTAVSVNLSVLDLGRYDIVKYIEEALLVAKLPPSRLQVEITETVFMKDMDKAVTILNTLRNLGVTIAIDDFGTGYSNLSLINDLPLNKVKIDRSFIRKIHIDPKAKTLFEAIVNLAKNIGLGIVVEGVESAEQLEEINKVGVDLIQGYLFGKPKNPREIRALIKSKRPTDTSNVINLIGRNAAS